MLTGGGGQVFGKKLFTPSEVAADKNAFVLICTYQPKAYHNISARLESLNIKYSTIDAAVFSLHKNEIRRIIDVLYDDRSREVYFNVMMNRALGRFSYEHFEQIVSWDRMFANSAFLVLNQNEVFVDCGAFVGDTIEEFITQRGGFLKGIKGFEPDANNFRALEKRVRRLREEWNFSDEAIQVYPYALSDKSTVSYFRRHDEIGTDSSIVYDPDEKTKEVRTIAIDDFMTEEFTFLKADVEGFEYKMLQGAVKSMNKWHPRLSICMYHNASDFCSIPLLVKELCPKYKLMIRHHLLRVSETVLYAW